MLKPFSKITHETRQVFRLVNGWFTELEESIRSLSVNKHRKPQNGNRKTIRRLDPDRSNLGILLYVSRQAFLSEKVLGKASVAFASHILNQLRSNSKTGLPRVWTPGLDLRNLLTDPVEENSNEIWPTKLENFRQLQRRCTRGKDPSHISVEWASLLAKRVRMVCGTEENDDTDDVNRILKPVSMSESSENNGCLRVGEPVPTQAANSIRRLRVGTVLELIDEGLVPSMEVLADLTG